MLRVVFTILGEPASKANRRRLIRDGQGRTRFVKSPEALAFERAALLQIPTQARVMYPGRVRVTLHLYYRTERPDLDESLVLDALQTLYTPGGQRNGKPARRGVILNDRQIREKHVYHAVDATNPRVVCMVESLGDGVRV